MNLKITQIGLRETQQYPWTHRVEVSDNILADVYYWEMTCVKVPGIWVGSNAFYTNSKGADFMALKWS